MTQNPYLWLIPTLPLAGAAINGFLGRRSSKTAVTTIALTFPGLAFALALWIALGFSSAAAPYGFNLCHWIRSGTFSVDFAFYLDQLSLVMLLVVTGVGFLIHIYSVGYMWDDPSYYRFFTYLNLFMFFMLTLVLANNYLLMFIGWEGVGLASYLLIGFWFTKDSAASAGKKAFIVNRIGDFGFLIGLFLIIQHFGSLTFTEVFSKVQPLAAETSGAGLLTAIGILLMVGACGKSAQIPLYVWLPDAMEGPTPVSALIHAATMVTAGVYMVARSHAIFERSPVALEVVAWIGVATALFAATIGLVQTDIKRVLAYSTVSQLGYMFAAVGVGAYAAGIFHLVTHAFFKALLFLGAGSVIHGLGGEQDLRKMGGLSSRMVATTITTTIGGLGLAGLPGLAGFFSKDEILAAAFGSGHRGIWALLLLGAFLTSFYTSRMLFLAFYSGPRMTREAAHHVHESPDVMTFPLWILALLTVITGVAFGIPSDHGTRFERFLAPVFPVHESGTSGAVALMLLVSAVAVFVAGVVVAWYMYMAAAVRPDVIGQPRTPIHALLLNAYYVDALYDRAIVRPLLALSRLLASVFDVRLVDGLVNAVARAVVAGAAGLRRIQTGYTVNYALTMLAGAVAIVVFLLTRS